MDAKDEEILALRTELEECGIGRFQQQSKEYEEALENEIASKDKTIDDLRQKLEQTQSDLKRMTEKYHRSESDLSKTQETAKEFLRELEKHRSEKRELELLNDDWERSKRCCIGRILEFSNQELEQKLNHAEEYMIMYKEELDELSQQNEVEIQRLKDQIKQLTDELSQGQTHNPQVDESQIKCLQDALQVAIEEKKKLKDELERPKVHRTTSTVPVEFQTQTQIFEVSPVEADQQDSDLDMEANQGGQSIRVFARVRKIFEDERSRSNCISCTPTCIDVKTKDLSIKKSGKPITKQFLFERVFDPSATNDDVYQACQGTIEAVSEGGNACIVAYGQTGSGKTYTMRGLIEQSLDTVTRPCAAGERMEISMQCIEVYNDLVRNLFTQESEGRGNKLKEFLAKSVIPLIDYSTEAIWELIAQANEARVTKYTDANEGSSRSHLLVTFFVRRGDVTGKLMFVDLAGSERLSSSKAKGDVYSPVRLKETLCINKSLTSLQDVIAALEAKAAYVPYRNSVLTTLLQPVLSSSDSKVLMLFMVSPTEEAVGETVCTLSLGVRLKSVELGSNIRHSLKDRNVHLEQVERTFLLLEKEREEKFALLRSKEKLERDVNSYLQAMKEKDNKIAVLAMRTKQLERDSFDNIARLKKEAEDYKQQFHQMSRKCRLLQAKLDSVPKIAPKKAENSSSPMTLTIEELPIRSVQTSLSPPREAVLSGEVSKVAQRSNGQTRPWLTPTAKKVKEHVARPQSVPKTVDSKIPSWKLSRKG